MDGLTQALLPIRVQPDPSDDKSVYLVDPPTVRQALLLYGLIPFYQDSSYEARIRQVMVDWLGGSGLLTYLREHDISMETQTILVRSLLDGCEPERKKKEESEEKPVWSRDESMSLLIAEYRHWYRCDVMEENWAVFLNQLRNLDKLKAEVGFANLAWYAAGKSEDSFESLMKRAGYERFKQDLPSMSDEEIAMQMENARLIGQMGQA